VQDLRYCPADITDNAGQNGCLPSSFAIEYLGSTREIQV
jgi:hypothetical protein